MSFRQLSLIWVGGMLLLGEAASLSAQSDVELLGILHGTRPPEAYYETLRRDPLAFQYRRGIWGRAREVQRRAELLARPRVGLLRFQAQLDDRISAAVGNFAFPTVLGLFSDTPVQPKTRTEIQNHFWSGPNPDGTIAQFYGEISYGQTVLTGVTYPWVQTSLTQQQVSVNGGMGSQSRTPDFIVEIVQNLDDGSIDWGQYDNDGPDGVPNSGDDDGYVDILAVVHPTPGGECGSSTGNRIWSHRWNLYAWASNYGNGDAWAQPILANFGLPTLTPAAGGGVIKILDYTIQPALACNNQDINDIGVFAHELGHGFGLPDLYANPHAGIGNWGLMGTGSWGCDGTSPELPCHPCAWTRAVLGWADVETLTPGTDLGTLTLPPVETSRKIYRADAGDGSGDYYLLENRQPIGFDSNIYQSGLLIWRIDADYLANRTGGVNSNPARMGVWLQEADGLNQLASQNGGRGNSGDPFPGSYENTAFHAGTVPASFTHMGTSSGLTIQDIAHAGDDMQFTAMTRYQTLTINTVGAPGTEGLVTVDGTLLASRNATVQSAPYQTHQIEASPGIETAPGVRVAFQGWDDGSPRVRTHTTQLSDVSMTATYGGEEIEITMELVGPIVGLSPGSISFFPGSDDGWVPRNTDILVTAVPRTGFGFVAWTGPLTGHPNPTTMQWAEPGSAGAVFDVIFSVAGNPASVQIEAAQNSLVTLQAEHANYPVTWEITEGTLPTGIEFAEYGHFSGAAMETGSFPLHLEIVDAIGLSGDLDFTLVVVSPQLSLQVLTARFLLQSSGLTPTQEEYLDQEGNGNGQYDVGDLRAFMLANPGLPTSGSPPATAEFVVRVGGIPGPVGQEGGTSETPLQGRGGER